MSDTPKQPVVLVGAGPGDPGLITVRGVEALSRAEVVVYDRLVNERLLDLAPAEAERIFVGKGPDKHTMSQDEINALLVKRATDGQRVVRLKGGDPFVFGRGGEEAEELRLAGVPFEVVPGVTSAIAAPAYAGIPVTHRGLGASVAFITGHEDPAKPQPDVDWTKLATAVDTIVLLMGVGQLAEIVERLVEGGRDPATPAALVEWGTVARQRTVTGTLGDIVARAERESIAPPAVAVIGDVVGMRDRLRWFDTRPLFGRRVLVTRTREQASELSRALAELGAEPVELPTISITCRYDEQRLNAAVDRLGDGGYGWAVFTSANAVEIFFRFMRDRDLDARSVRARVAAIGSGTAEALRRWGIRVDLTPEGDSYTAEGLLAALEKQGGLRGGRVLLPRAEGARDVLTNGLADLGVDVDEVTLYVAALPEGPGAEDVPPALEEGLRRLRAGEIDIATFASSSTVRNLVALLGEDVEPIRRCRIAAIGPVTAATVEELVGRKADIVAEEHTIPGLVRALAERYGTTGK